MKPLAIDLYAGLGGWSDGLLAEGYDCVGFDIERHQYGEHRYPAQLVLQDVRTLHGSQFRNAALIVASPPCQGYSYRAMPWSRAKALPPPDNTLFEQCFRIQREACEAAGRHIPIVVENVRGAQKWVGRARWSFGSFYLWGDVPALMPITHRQFKVGGVSLTKVGFNVACVRKFAHGDPTMTMAAGRQAMEGVKGVGASWDAENGRSKRGVRRWTNPAEHDGTKNGNDWFGSGPDCSLHRRASSGSSGRRFASAMIAKIPLPLARHIAAVYYPRAN